MLTIPSPTPAAWPRPSGRRIPSGFGYLESSRFDAEIVKDLLTDGHRDGKVLYILRDRLSTSLCDRVIRAFHVIADSGRNSRPDDGYVKAQQFGATQFAKTGRDYILDVSANVPVILSLLDALTHDEALALLLTRDLEEGLLAHGLHFGPAQHKGCFAASATFRQWLDNGKMSLMPHDDVAQLAVARRDGFEIGTVRTVLAYNACLRATGEGGALTVWNLEPNDGDRAAFGVEETGYPYPPEQLGDVAQFSVTLNAGDVYFLNASFLHGVETVRNGERVTAGRFMGLSRREKVVHWT
ncbi:2OG-Fe(II)-dependent halogenase WelO5 family protein [Methylobacterium sp. JK268]